MNENEFGGTKIQRKPSSQVPQAPQMMDPRQMQQIDPQQMDPRQMDPRQMDPRQVQQMDPRQVQQMDPRQVQQMDPRQVQQMGPRPVQQQVPFFGRKETLVDEKVMKYAILVILIFIILNSKIIWKQIMKLPMMGTTEPSIVALIVNSIIAGIIFYVVTTMIIK
jgi:hypothetical protein